MIAGAEPVARHLESVLVGRERERTRLRREYEDAVADRACRLVTLLGPAGVGKSRLVADFLEHARQEADVLHGRCLNYGEGITYWPLVELLLAIGVEPDTVLGSSAAETQLAFRRLLEERAAERPQIVVFDDIHWAEPTFLELIEHIADLSRGAPILLLCVARTELLDAQPGWGGGKLNATSLLLEPLGADDCDRLIDTLAADAIDDETRQRIIVASEGNPLFVARDARDGARAARRRRARRSADDPRAPPGAAGCAPRRRAHRHRVRLRRGRGVPPRLGCRARPCRFGPESKRICPHSCARS